ncbi:hypothetical protein [Psychromonas sp. KJ10-2]|uniref:hypothetical protein n=1 Tax=Psychromonas sp. KJ10-2 TaxID=3391822 RepID=UPI0039B381D8
MSPEKGNNALQAACMAVTNLHGISRHGDGITRINTGKFTSDNPTNVISDYAEFELELRGENNHICQYLYDKTNDIIKGAALMYGVEPNIEDYGKYVNADNANSVISFLKQAALNSGLKEEMIIDRHLSSACEDAPFLMNQVNNNKGSASYLCLGSPTFAGHHHPEFDFDEDMLIYGVDILWEFIQCVLLEKNLIKLILTITYL